MKRKGKNGFEVYKFCFGAVVVVFFFTPHEHDFVNNFSAKKSQDN